ncbi:MAG TPA: S41 family peptidase [Gemmatimonadaceae bacterium]|nr:S41 family peptidase [Gemmatimonadaceae bacterium]
MRNAQAWCRHGIVALLFLIILGCGARTGSTVNANGPVEQQLAAGIAVASFDSLWSIVNRTYVDTAFVARRWGPVRDSLRPRAERIRTKGELDDLLRATLTRIPESHFYILPSTLTAAEEDAHETESSGGGTTGIAVRFAGGQVVVWQVQDGSPADSAGVNPGDIIESIGDRVAATSLTELAQLPASSRQRARSDLLRRLNGALSPESGRRVKLRSKSAANSSVDERVIVAVPLKGTVSKFGNLPPITGIVRVSHSVPREDSGDRGCVGVIAFNIWLPALAPELENAVTSTADCVGIVIDLRGNPGGVGGMVMGFGGYFVATPLSLGTMEMRDMSLKFAINPRRRTRMDGGQSGPFSGPVAILVDPLTGSTSEIFAAGMQRIGRATVFGEPSAGAALPAIADTLPSGDVFVHAIADFRDPHGKRIEGVGVIPDHVIPLDTADLKRAVDAPLEAALRWIRSKARAVRSN